MRSERIGKNALKITLTGSELKGAGLTPGELLSRGERFEGFVKALRERLIQDPAFDDITSADFGERPSVEIIPGKDKGCVIYITGGPSEAVPPEPKYAASFPSTKPLLAVCGLLRRASLSRDCSLWANGQRALLIFRLPQRKCALADAITEYAAVNAVNGHMLAAVTEHMEPIIEKNAPEILIKAYGEK